MIAAATAADVEGLEMNLGTGREISIGDLVALVMNLAGRRVPIASDALRLRPAKSEVDRLLADNSMAQQRTGWKPEVTLEDGLSRTMAWISEHLDRFRPGVYEV
jgi:dTDP-glucose 4,6-dehydratase